MRLRQFTGSPESPQAARFHAKEGGLASLSAIHRPHLRAKEELLPPSTRDPRRQSVPWNGSMAARFPRKGREASFRPPPSWSCAGHRTDGSLHWAASNLQPPQGCVLSAQRKGVLSAIHTRSRRRGFLDCAEFPQTL
jgi:hypothetical protein